MSPPYPAEVVIYTTRLCGFCFAAKRLLDQKGAEYREIAADGRSDLRSWLREVTGQRTVPQIFINDESIGGFTELAALEGSGELEGKLTSPRQGDFSRLRS